MHSRNRWIMVALAALVAAAAVIVYANRAARMSSIETERGSGVTTEVDSTAPKSPAVTEVPKSAEPAKPPEPEPAAIPAESLPAPAAVPLEPLPPAESPSAALDTNAASGEALPAPVKRMRQAIVGAARSGDIEELRPVLEMNELKPMVAPAAVQDPIAYWKKHSADGQGRDVLAALLTVLNSGFVRVQDGKEVMYVWPYFAEKDLATLTPEQAAEFNRVVPPAQAVPMQQSGNYTYYRVGIAADGVWHYFLQ